MVECLFMNYVVVGSSLVAVTSVFAPSSSKEFLDIQATIEFGFTLKRVRDMIRTCRQELRVCFKRPTLKLFRKLDWIIIASVCKVYHALTDKYADQFAPKPITTKNKGALF